MAQIIDGKKISLEIKDEVKKEVETLAKKSINPCLAVILVGENPASLVYVRNKKKACEYVGIKSLSPRALLKKNSLTLSTALIKILNATVFLYNFLCLSI